MVDDIRKQQELVEDLYQKWVSFPILSQSEEKSVIEKKYLKASSGLAKMKALNPHVDSKKKPSEEISYSKKIEVNLEDSKVQQPIENIVVLETNKNLEKEEFLEPIYSQPIYTDLKGLKDQNFTLMDRIDNLEKARQELSTELTALNNKISEIKNLFEGLKVVNDRQNKIQYDIKNSQKKKESLMLAFELKNNRIKKIKSSFKLLLVNFFTREKSKLKKEINEVTAGIKKCDENLEKCENKQANLHSQKENYQKKLEGLGENFTKAAAFEAFGEKLKIVSERLHNLKRDWRWVYKQLPNSVEEKVVKQMDDLFHRIEKDQIDCKDGMRRSSELKKLNIPEKDLKKMNALVKKEEIHNKMEPKIASLKKNYPRIENNRE
ncbi:hypothetical protein [Enterococcus ratti]|nr:hypothetical protein [Enterococcus ratti]